jgi:hypothetical protein
MTVQIPPIANASAVRAGKPNHGNTTICAPTIGQCAWTNEQVTGISCTFEQIMRMTEHTPSAAFALLSVNCSCSARESGIEVEQDGKVDAYSFLPKWLHPR